MNEKIKLSAKVKKIDSGIKKALKKANIQYPHESLGFFKAIYAKVDGKTPNGNGVILAKSVKDNVPYLIGTQVNRDHIREGYIMGSIIDSSINENEEIEIVFTFAKNVYPEEYELALELMKDEKLTVSFELSVDKKDVEVVEGRYRKLKNVSFDGVGLLFDIKPAYANAHVLETAMRIIERTFEHEGKQLLYASAKDITQKWVRIGELIEKALQDKSNKGDIKMDKKANDALLAAQKKLVSDEFGEEVVKGWSDEDFLNQDKIDEVRESLKATEEKVEDKKVEDKADEKADEKVEDKKVEDKASYQCECVSCGKKTTLTGHCKDSKCSECGGDMRRVDRPGTGKGSEEKVEDKAKESEETAEKTVVEEDVKINQKVTYDDEKNEETIEVESERVVKRDDKIKVVEKTKSEVTYSYAQVKEIKAEYELKISEKEKEIEFLKENAQKIIEVRSELGDFVEDLSDEDLLDDDKLEKARLQKRVNELETANEKEEDVDEKKPEDKDLKTGHEEKEQIEEESSSNRIHDYLKNKYGEKK